VFVALRVDVYKIADHVKEKKTRNGVEASRYI